MLDWSRIRDLQDEIGQDSFEEVAELFMDEVQEGLNALAACTDPPSTLAQLHFLKGSALNLGFRALATQCGAFEASVSKGKAVDLSNVQEVFEASKEQYFTQKPEQLAA